jgi:hypothetical protein
VTFGAASVGVSKLTHRADFVPIESGSHVAAMTCSAVKTAPRGIKHEGAGYGSLVAYARFFAWATEQTHFPMPEQVSDRFGTCKATSNRWLNALAEAYGVDRPKRGRDGRVRGVPE